MLLAEREGQRERMIRIQWCKIYQGPTAAHQSLEKQKHSRQALTAGAGLQLQAGLQLVSSGFFPKPRLTEGPEEFSSGHCSCFSSPAATGTTQLCPHMHSTIHAPLYSGLQGQLAGDNPEPPENLSSLESDLSPQQMVPEASSTSAAASLSCGLRHSAAAKALPW